MSSLPPPVMFLMGPTAAGKTAAAVRLVEKFPFEIVSVDSALIYRGLDIGAARPERDVLERAPHRLIDIADPTERYSAGQFGRDARAAVADIRQTGKIPLLVGGTLLYYRAYARGLADLPSSDSAVRAEIDARAGKLGWSAMHAELARADPAAAARIHPNDTQRIQRALEVILLTGRRLSELQAAQQHTSLTEDIYRLAWCPSRETVYKNCEKRLNLMIEQGFLKEVEKLHARPGLSASHPAMRSVGYRQFWRYLDGECSLSEATRQAMVATRRLAKRQLTWLRSEAGVVWVDPESSDAVDSLYQLAERVVRRSLA